MVRATWSRGKPGERHGTAVEDRSSHKAGKPTLSHHDAGARASLRSGAGRSEIRLDEADELVNAGRIGDPNRLDRGGNRITNSTTTNKATNENIVRVRKRRLRIVSR